MKKYSVIFSFMILLAVSSVSNAYTYDYASIQGNGGYTSPYAGVTVITFDGELPDGWNLSGNYQITQGTDSDAAAPWYNNGTGGARDNTNYLSVPKTLSNPEDTRSATIKFGGSAKNYFGLWWGSMDTYNTFEFLGADFTEVVATVYGTTFSSGSGNQTSADTNKYVNFYGLGDFYGVRITSTSYAFEVDNIAVGKNVVPEPASMLLLGLGLMGLAGVRRKIRK